MSAEIIDGKTLTASFREQLDQEVDQLQEESQNDPHLTANYVGEDPASAVYVRNKQRASEKVWIRSTLKRLPAETTEAELLELVHELNADRDVHGILVQLPLPKHITETAILDVVNPLKDVDAFHPENVGLIVQGRPRYLPCTPYGIQQMILSTNMETAGKHAVILGRSEIVGKPMAMLLIQRGLGADATVTICHSRTQNLKEIVRSADIIIAADNDQWTDGNPGLTKARQAAAITRSKVIYPDFTGMDTSSHPTDFNDYVRLGGVL